MSAEKASPTAKASYLSTGKAWIWAVVASERGPQRRLRRRRVILAASRASPFCRPSCRPHRQGEQVQQRIEIRLLAQLLQVEPHHLLLQEHLQRLGGAELEAAVGRNHQHSPVLHLVLLLQKAVGLRRQAVVEALVGVHLHLQQHHRELGAAGFSAAGGLARPQNSIEAVAAEPGRSERIRSGAL